jgi:hypothetical protein
VASLQHSVQRHSTLQLFVLCGRIVSQHITSASLFVCHSTNLVWIECLVSMFVVAGL